MEPTEEVQSARLGLMIVGAIILALPLALAFVLASWSLAAAAWHLLMAQITG